MSRLSATEIGKLVRQAGFTGSDVRVAIAVVLAESRGETTARGDTARVNATWGPSIGLFQIRSLNAEKGKGTVRDEEANMDPLTNARHALEIKNSSGWSAWTVYTTQAYRLFLPDAIAGEAASAGQAAVEGSAVGKAAASVANTSAAIIEVAKEPARWLEWVSNQETQLRIAKVVVGGGLVLAGLVMFARPVVGKVPGAGKALKLIGV